MSKYIFPGDEQPGKAQNHCQFHIVYFGWALDSPQRTPVLKGLVLGLYKNRVGGGALHGFRMNP